MKRAFFILLTFVCLTSVVFSLDNDYKNVLTKIDIVKVSDNSYRVDLHTKNPYMSPVKAIFVSDIKIPLYALIIA